METQQQEQQAEKSDPEQPHGEPKAKLHELASFTATCFLLFGLLFAMSGGAYAGMYGAILSLVFWVLARLLKANHERSQEAKRKNIWQ